MRYATNSDWILLSVGFASSVVTGALTPLSQLVSCQMLNTLIDAQRAFDSNGRIDKEPFAKQSPHLSCHYFLSLIALLVDHILKAFEYLYF